MNTTMGVLHPLTEGRKMRFIIKPLGAVVLVTAIVGLGAQAFLRRDRVVVREVEKVVIASPTPAADLVVQSGPNLLQNGAMDDRQAGYALPTHWGDPWIGKGKLNTVLIRKPLNRIRHRFVSRARMAKKYRGK